MSTEILIDKMRQLVDIQCSNGNWDCDPYMHGMANGMILMLAVAEDKQPLYLERPARWRIKKPFWARVKAVFTGG